MEPTELIASLERAVAATPDDQPLRVHLAKLLMEVGRTDDAIRHIANLLVDDPSSVSARDVMLHLLTGTLTSEAGTTVSHEPNMAVGPDPVGQFDWQQAERNLGSDVEPMFVDASSDTAVEPTFDVEASELTLRDVGGMTEVKRRLNAAFLAPLRNERLRTLYRKSLRGGLLLYGPPGVGKTYIARALAGEIKAHFIAVSVADVLDIYVGSSERNLHEVFELARSNAPCVVFFDEIDAIGRKRSQASSDAYRSTVNQLLLELDGLNGANDGVFVLAATNSPWDVDAALRRPGRLDRTILVLPPDVEAREAIWQGHLKDRPVGGVNLKRLAALTDGFTGADIAHACESASEFALMQAVESGEIGLIHQADIERALREVRPSIGPWMETARNIALFANGDGTYDELANYLRKHRRL